MVLRPSFPAVSGAANFLDMRLDLAGLVARDTQGRPRAGIFPQNSDPLLSGRNDRAVDVQMFNFVANRNGAVFGMHEGTTAVPIGAAPASNSRWDVIYVKQNETRSPFADPTDGPTFGVLAGVAAANPQERTDLPAGAVKVGAVKFPAGAVTTLDSGVEFRTNPQWTAAEGGVVLCRDAADLAAWTPHDDSIARRLDTGREYRRINGAWVDRRTRSRLIAFVGGSILLGGGTRDIGSWNQYFAAGTDITVEIGTYLYFPANAAGQFQLKVDGVVVNERRWHTHDKAGFETFTNTLYATVAAGTHTVTASVYSDSTSTGSEIWDASALLTVNV
jgi:hypothetical protein